MSNSDFDPDAYLSAAPAAPAAQSAAAGGFDPDSYLAANPQPSLLSRIGSGVGAAWEGVKSGLTAGWAPQLRGAMASSGLEAEEPYLTDEELADIQKQGGLPGAYAEAKKEETEAEKTAQAQHPGLYGTGNIAGAIAPMMFLGPAEAAPTLLGRAGQAMTMGGIYGGLAGAAPGNDVQSKLEGAAVGAGTGALAGAVSAPIAEGVGQAAGFLSQPIVNTLRGALNPDAEAARRIIVAAQHDLAASGPNLTADEMLAAQRAGIPRAIIDAGGETTRALARSAANTSPEARSALAQFINDRFESQAPRAAAFLDQLVGGAGDVGATSEALQAVARRMNRPAYAAAYQAGSGGLWSPELERLTGSPALVRAMQAAATNGKTRAIADGFGGFRPGVTVTPDGRIMFNRGPTGVPSYPDLQFWDYTYRGLRDAGQQAIQSGLNSEGSAINAVAGSLRNELDSMVPEYAAARTGAARWFGANDALEAGQQFATSRLGNADAARAVSAMNPAERALFMRGYASQLINRINETGDRRNIANVFGNSPADRQRGVIALGQQNANQLEAYIRAERILDVARGAVTGNSTTARQLAELGLAGGAYGIGTQGDLMHPTPGGVLAAALTYGALRGNAAINQRLAQRVGEMLTSNDPAVLQQGFRVLGRNGAFLRALRGFDTASMTGAGTVSGVHALPPPSIGAAYGQNNQQNVNGPPPQQKNGGAVGVKNGFAHGGKIKPKFRPESIGARKAKDGRYYIYAPHSRGNWQLVVPRR